MKCEPALLELVPECASFAPEVKDCLELRIMVILQRAQRPLYSSDGKA